MIQFPSTYRKAKLYWYFKAGLLLNLTKNKVKKTYYGVWICLVTFKFLTLRECICYILIQRFRGNLFIAGQRYTKECGTVTDIIYVVM